MELTHTTHDSLACLFIGIDAEGWVFFSQALQGNTHLFLVSLGLGFHRDRYRWLGEANCLKSNWMRLIAQGMSCKGTLQAHHSSNVTSTHAVDFFALIGVHPDDAPHTLLLTCRRVKNVATGSQATAVDADKDQLTNEWVGSQLEGQCGHWLLIVRCAAYFIASLGVLTPDLTNIEWAWQVIYHQVKHLLDDHTAAIATCHQEEVTSQDTLT